AVVILFGLQTALFGTWTIPFVAFITALSSLFVVLRLANVQGKYHLETIILSGVVVSAFLGSFVSFMVSMSDKVVNEIVFCFIGSISDNEFICFRRTPSSSFWSPCEEYQFDYFNRINLYYRSCRFCFWYNRVRGFIRTPLS